MRKGYVAIVGSREAPIDELELMIRLGRTFTDLGYADSSGDAFGSDRAGWYGAIQSDRYPDVGSRIYLTQSYKNRRRAEEHGFIIAEDYPECWPMAMSMALAARGSFGGLNEYGIGLHTRNVYQILGHELNEPVKLMFYYAKPVGNPAHGKVSGGTNTAVQLALQAGIEQRINLATKEGYEYAEGILKLHELDKPYKETDWRQILKPDDPRLEYLT